MQQPKVRTGLDVLIEGSFLPLKGRRLGLLAHQASVASDLSHIVVLMLKAGLDLRVLFAPEHGLDGVAQDMEEVIDAGIRIGGVPVLSLYGRGLDSLRPPPGVLDDIDLLVVDLQDVGSRYYTFAVSMRYCMEACAKAGVGVVVLDRPNPINGIQFEGPLLLDAFRSFVGGYRVPVRHGLTMGELAKLAVLEGVDVELDIIDMQGWKRCMWYDQTGLVWIAPSPNMPILETALVYPGACLIEATNLSEGRGTTHPFEMMGAPWLDGARLAEKLNARKLPGVRFRPISFRPVFQKHADRLCGGIQQHILDRDAYRPFTTGVHFLQHAKEASGQNFGWRDQPYEFVSDRPAIDLLAGGTELRERLCSLEELSKLIHVWDRKLDEFRALRHNVMLYPEDKSWK